SPAADTAWQQVQAASLEQVQAKLAAFARDYPSDRRAADAQHYANLLRESQRSAGARRLNAVVEAMSAEARRTGEAGDLARAHALLELASALVPGTPVAARLGIQQTELREAAVEQFRELQDEARTLARRLGPVAALVQVLEARTRLKGLGQDEALTELVAELEEAAAQVLAQRSGGQVEQSAEALTMEKDGVDAALRFDFPKAWEHLDALLVLSLRDETRLRAHWVRHQVRALEDLVAAMVEAAGGPRDQRPSLTVRGDLRARLVSCDANEVLLAPIVEQGSGELRWPWSRITPYQQQELLWNVTEGDQRLSHAKAFLAFKTGLEDRGVEILLPFANKRRYKSETFSFYALATDTPMPEGGFVLFEGRLVSPFERDRVLASREEAREAARELRELASAENEQAKLERLLQRILAIMQDGHYEEGRAALAYMAQQHADVPGVGDEAQRWLDSPVLRRRDLRVAQELGVNGPSTNRLDIYLMGDGFVLDDRKQIQFDRNALQCMKFNQQQDFFKEYDQYMNYWAVNLASAEEGLTRDGEVKDTAMRGQINGGTYTIPDRGHVFGILRDHWPDEHDQLAVGIGNDFAGVATGGGGIVACAKTMLSVTAHELGHAYGALGDEYDYEPGPGAGGPPPSAAGRVPASVMRPNLVAGNRRDEILDIVPWKGWLDPVGTANWSGKPVDIFEGGNRQPKDVWRPQRACVMRDVGSPFCVMCMEVMMKRLYTHVRPIDQVWPDEAEIVAEGTDAITLRVLVMTPKTHDLMVHWRRRWISGPGAPAPDPEDPDGTRIREGAGRPDGEPEVTDITGRVTTDGVHVIHFIKVKPGRLDSGRWEFSAEVWDPTPWVLEESRELLTQTRKWEIVVP
ncbi:M64 family metallo-endopeptidase, partial [Planctomycetota bacterium]|nr:M64 family metallo-endopeptidase [Planctomycetota bacterium]